MRVTAETIDRVQNDPDRPQFHFCPPVGWMNDPNGTIFHHGYYHLFYQHHPYSDEWAAMHWGHARSRDLVHWEHLPIALAPATAHGEDHCFSGCVVARQDDAPLLLYTSISQQRTAEQWAAIGSDDLLTWQRSEQNPILTETIHDEPISEWRDPFVFHADDRTFLLLGGRRNERAVVFIYEAQDATLLKWRYRGIFFEHADPEILSVECVNVVQLGERWVMLVSVYQHVEYYSGIFDAQAATFSPTAHGRVDARHFYATNTLIDDQQRTICFGWIRGFTLERGWNGCLSLPRVLRLDEHGHLLQEPVPELARLRRAIHHSHNQPLGTYTQADVGNSLELHAMISTPNQQAWQIKLEPNNPESLPISLIATPSMIQLNDMSAELAPCDTYEIQLFVDRTVVEVFVNRRVCLTLVLPTSSPHYQLTITADQGALLDALNIYHIEIP